MSDQSFSFTSLPFDIRHKIYRILLISPGKMLVKNYSQSGVRPSQYKIEPGTELLHRSYSNKQIWREASEVYYGENTFLMSLYTMIDFLQATGNFPIDEMHSPRGLIRNIELNLGHLGKLGMASALRQIDILLTYPGLQNVLVTIWTSLIPHGPSNGLIAKGHLSTIVGALRKLKAHVGKSMSLSTYDSGTIPFGVKYVGRDSIRYGENLSWLLDVPSEQSLERVTKGQGSLRECLMMEMATKWAPVSKGQAEGDSPSEKNCLAGARSAALGISARKVALSDAFKNDRPWRKSTLQNLKID